MKLKAALVGATGIAGQQFISALRDHPWFEISHLGGSPRSAHKTYEKALTLPSGQLGWWQPHDIPDNIASMTIFEARELPLEEIDLVFTAVESDAARELEPIFAAKKPTISTASAFRMEADVPLLIPGINDDHLGLLDHQKTNRNWQGFIVPIPNCTVYGLASTLAPLHKKAGIKSVIVTSLQAISGAGRNSGVLGLDITDNVIPYIPGEEEKVNVEAQKILGEFNSSAHTIEPAEFHVSATCTRVPVIDGHTEAVWVKTRQTLTAEDAAQLYLAAGEGRPRLPSLTGELYRVHSDPFRPQPRKDRDGSNGMTTHIGRLSYDAPLDFLKYVLLSHNTKAGAAQGAILVAELLRHRGYIKG